MKILSINNLYPPHDRGGAEQVVRRRVQYELAQGNKPVVVTWGPWHGFGSWRPVQTLENGIVVYRFWVPQIFSYTNLSQHVFVARLLWHAIDLVNFWSARIIKKIIQKEKPDTVESHNLMGMGYCIPRMIQRLKISHTQVLHDVQLVEPSGILLWNHSKDSFGQKLYSAIIKYCMGNPDHVVVFSKFLQDFYVSRDFFPDAVWQVAEYEQIRTEIVKDARKHFLFVGSLEVHKGLAVLMAAWDLLPKESNKTLDIVGSGTLLESIKRWATDKPSVTVHGRLSQESLALMYKKNDVLIFSSICIENRPTVIVEAIRYGVYIVAANTGGVSELFTSKQGTLFEPGSVEGLAGRIVTSTI